MLHEVLVEPEGKFHVQGTGHGSELNHVLLHVARVSELSDLLTEASTRALGHLLPEEHPLRVQGVHLRTSDLDLNLTDHGVPDGVHPVRGLVGVGHGVARRVQHSRGSLDRGKQDLEHDVRHEVAVARNIGTHLLPETNRTRRKVVLLKVLGEVSVALVLSLEQGHVGTPV